MSPEFMGVAEVAEHLGVTKQVISAWKRRGKLPTPVAELKMTTVWRYADIEVYHQKRAAGKGNK